MAMMMGKPPNWFITGWTRLGTLNEVSLMSLFLTTSSSANAEVKVSIVNWYSQS
jgi:hypothetical protein